MGCGRTRTTESLRGAVGTGAGAAAAAESRTASKRNFLLRTNMATNVNINVAPAKLLLTK